MKDEQSNIEVSAAAAENGNLAPPKSAGTGKWRKRSSDFDGNTATVEFLSAITYVVKTFVQYFFMVTCTST